MKRKVFITVVVGVVRDKNRILMTLRNEKMNLKAHSQWELPGGIIEFGEKPEQTLKREIKEETGYTIKIVKQIPTTFTYLWKYPKSIQHTLLIGYECRKTAGKMSTKDREVKQIAWKEINKINFSDTLPGTKEFIKHLLK